MSDYQFSLSVAVPGVPDIRAHLGAIAELATGYVDLSSALSYGGLGAPEWDCTLSHPSTVYVEGESRWEVEADLDGFAAAVDAILPGAEVTLAAEWRGDGEPYSTSETFAAAGRVATRLETALAAAHLTLALDDGADDLAPALRAALTELAAALEVTR